MRAPKPKRVSADQALMTMQFYLGAIAAKESDAAVAKIRKELDRLIAQLSARTGHAAAQVWGQLEAEAHRRGIVRPGFGS